MKLKRKILVVMLACMSLVWCGVRWGNARSVPSSLRSSPNDELADCPNSPNCVSTSSSQLESKIEPMALRESVKDAKYKLEDIIRHMSGSRIILSQDGYLHAEFRSRIFGFVDDLEIFIDNEQQLILMRSASRVGYSDLGVNRNRCEEIRRRYASF